MKKRAILILILFILHIPLTTAFAQELDLNTAGSCILIDSKTGQILYGKDLEDKEVYPASTTKIMTAILAIESGKLEEIVTISQNAVNEIGKDGMNIGLMPGEGPLRLMDILHAMLLSSANEAANIIAENVSPTKKDFIQSMNQRAIELGALDTHFVNTCGIHDSDHYTTAEDLAKIARHAMSLQAFRDIVEKKSYTLPATNKHESWPAFPITNIDSLRYKSKNGFRINGIKTGFTTEAGHNLVTSGINENGMELISVVLGVKANSGTASKRNSQVYSQNLLEYGFSHYSNVSLIDANKIVKTVSVKDSKWNYQLNIVTAETFLCVLANDESKENIKSTISMIPSIAAPISKGAVLGTISFEKNGLILGKVNLIASESVEKNTLVKLLDLIKKGLAFPLVKIILIVFALFLVLRTTLSILSKKLNIRKRK